MTGGQVSDLVAHDALQLVGVLGLQDERGVHAMRVDRVDPGQRTGSANYELAISHGFQPVSAEEAAKRGDLINILLPDEVQADVLARSVQALADAPPDVQQKMLNPLKASKKASKK